MCDEPVIRHIVYTDLPASVDILGLTYSIELVDLIDDDADLLGMIFYKEQIIKIRNSLSKERKQQTLLHEILHGLNEQMGYPLGYEREGEDGIEHLVQALSGGLYQTLKPYLSFRL